MITQQPWSNGKVEWSHLRYAGGNGAPPRRTPGAEAIFL